MPKKTKTIVSEEDRSTLRTYLTRRLKSARRSIQKSCEREEAYYHEGAEMELLFLFDELLGEEPPDLRKKPVAQ